MVTSGGQSSDEQNHCLKRISFNIILHSNIYLALKYPEKLYYPLWTASCWRKRKHCVIVCATRGYTNAADHWRPRSCCIHHNIMKYMELMHFMLKCSVSLFLMVTWFQCPTKTSDVVYGNSFSNERAFAMLETEVIKYNTLNFYIAKACCIFCWNFYCWCKMNSTYLS